MAKSEAHEVTIRIGGKDVVVEFTHHSLRRMETRGIKISDVTDCLRLPDQKGLECDEGRKRWGRFTRDGSRRLDVIFEVISEDRYRVITAVYKSGRGI